MRRPALYRPAPADTTAWTHPYTGLAAVAVFYNDGGGAPQPPAPAAPPAHAPGPVPGPPAPAPAPGAPEPLIDHETGVAMTQARFSKIMTRENGKGRTAALRELAEAAGLTFDPETTSAETFAKMIKDAETARQAQLSEEQRRTEELAAREQQIADRERQAQEREAAAARRDRESRIRAALVGLGATGDDLDDATALLRVADDADDAAITQAAEALKKRRAELFGGTSPSTLPPAPSGGPAGGPPPRNQPGSKDAVAEAARKRAEAMGLRTSA
ncbi:hypothetical protein ABZ404_36815 [Streptomyces sp. NPDC005878]|uniref:hypothetical protein n=1 Tax=Streptomyces sp. NPDC005878 TaxID=3157077 RepID=UPI0033D45836